MNVIEFKNDNKEALVDGLRQMLADAEAGLLTQYIAIATNSGHFEFHWSAGVSLIDAVAYSAILHDAALRKMRI